eukprot:3239563-Lingulodinium_polyedra.AAC.1
MCIRDSTRESVPSTSPAHHQRQPQGGADGARVTLMARLRADLGGPKCTNGYPICGYPFVHSGSP